LASGVHWTGANPSVSTKVSAKLAGVMLMRRNRFGAFARSAVGTGPGASAGTDALRPSITIGSRRPGTAGPSYAAKKM
jgi:hypothetical protein